MSKLLITGATPRPPPGVASPPRLEITAFVKEENLKQFSLYIQALLIIYGRDKNVVDAYYQIAGIHGRPYVDWNQSPSFGRGYCAHQSLIFPTWHTPYVVLFEQEVQIIAKQIAATYPSDRPAWEKAAADLRQPYWGWDNLSTVVPPPQVISMDRVEIIMPNGRVPVPNPLLSYTFPDKASTSTFPSPFNNWTATARNPDQNGQTDVDKLRASLTAIGPQVVKNTALLYSIDNWNDFVFGSSSATGLESIHDTMHVRVGGFGPSGNMTSVAVAAFDPIFYLHHAQIDRVVVTWYNRHQKWATDGKDLTPFWRTQTTYWVSPTIIDPTTVFNYSYRLGALEAMADDEKVSAEVPIENPAHNPAGHNPVEVSDDQRAQSAEDSGSGRLQTVDEWSVSVKCKKFELGGSFSVFIFLGEVPADPKQWLTDPAFAGTFDVFANETPEECGNCIDRADQILHGFVYVNDAILKRSGKDSLDPRVVLPYLKSNLNWRVQKANGEVAKFSEVPSLEVTVLVTPFTLSPGSKIPVAGEPHYYHDVTRGRPGGDRQTEF